MINISLIDSKEIEQVIEKESFDFVSQAVRDAFHLYMTKNLCQPRKTKLTRPSGAHALEDRIFALPVYAGEEIAGIKWTSRHPHAENHVLIVLNEAVHNRPIAIMDGQLVALLRTFSITKLSLDALLPDVKTLAVIGMGKLGRMHARYLPTLYPCLEKIKCFSYNAPFDDLLSDKIQKCFSLEETLADVDAVILCGRQRPPYITPQLISSQTRLIVNLALFDLHEEVFSLSGAIFIDDPDSCLNSIIPLASAYKKGVVPAKKISLFGELLKENKIFPPSHLSIVNTQGMGSQDVILAKRIYDKINNASMPQFSIV